MPADRPDTEAFDRRAWAEATGRLGRLRRDLPEDAMRDLAGEVLQRLASRRVPTEEADPREIAALCTALLSDDAEAGMRLIAARARQGVAVKALYLGWLAPAARQLGLMWETDAATFSDVTMAVGRIYAILRGLRAGFAPVVARNAAFFAAVPGEEHVLGLRMAADLCRAAGWDIVLRLETTHDGLVAEIAQSDVRVIGLSASHGAAFLPMARLVAAIRAARPDAGILLAGGLATDPSARLMGADAVAEGYAEALAAMHRLAGLPPP
jgi:MerR family transcriptional regulator, light-induced transcriptional regulator